MRIKSLIAFEALTVAVFSTLHLSGALHVGGRSGSSVGAGVAEALICIALLIGLARGQRAALAALVFAVFGFIVGLTFTVRGGDAIDLAYHATMLPILILTALLVRPRRRPRDPRPTARTSAAASR